MNRLREEIEFNHINDENYNSLENIGKIKYNISILILIIYKTHIYTFIKKLF